MKQSNKVPSSSKFSCLVKLNVTYAMHNRNSLPRFIGYTAPEGVEQFVKEVPVKQSGATVTYGPYANLPPSTSDLFTDKYQQAIMIHYHHDQPVLELSKLERFAEISHWGANLNIEDKIVLYNAGPKFVFCLDT